MDAVEGATVDTLGLVGTILERKYRVDRVVAEGGFGIVYEAHHLALGVPVAIKILRPALRAEQDAFVEIMSQFREEANVLSRLRGASVVAVMDAGVSSLGGELGGLPWMALEWLEGETLKAHLARRRGQGGRTPEACLELLRPVLEAIAEAHARKIVHRDIKPSNIMLVPAEGGASLRVLDFGIAKIMAPGGDEASNGETATDAQRRAFTPASAAPEQLSGSRTGPWTDVYALGLLLTELLTDRPPVAAYDANERYRAAFARERPTPARAGVDVGPWEAVLTRALAVRPSDRQRDARALLDELEAALADTTGTAPASVVAAEVAPRTGRRRSPLQRFAAILAALGALFVAGSGANYATSARGDGGAALPAPRPRVIVSEFRARGAAGAEATARRLAATFAELLSEQLRIGDGVHIPDADTRVAMLQASGLDVDDPAVTPELLSRLRATTGADVVVGGEITLDRGALAARIDLYDGSRGEPLTRVSFSQAASDVNAFVREAGARVRRSLGRPPLSAENEKALFSTLPESAEASMVYVEGLSAMRVFHFREAADHFEAAHRLAPRFAPALAGLASARLRLGEQSRAQEAAEEAARLAASLPRGDELGVHALAAETRHDWATAVDDYRALVRFYPDRVDYTTSLARALVGIGKAPDAIRILEDAKKRQGSDWDRMRIDLLESFAYARQSQDDASMEAAREAEQFASRVGARVPLAEAVFKRAWVLLRAGRLADAEALFERARAVYVEVEDDGSVLSCDAGLVEIAKARGEIDRAVALGERIVAAHRASGNLYQLGRETVSLGLVHASAGRLTRARALFDEGGRAFIEAHDREGEAYRLMNLASMDLWTGHIDGVADKFRRGRAIHLELGHAAGVADADGGLAQLAWYEGRLADAEAAYEAAHAEAVAAKEIGVVGAYEAAHAEAVAAKEISVLAAIALDRARLAFERRSAAEAARFEDAGQAVNASSDLRLLALLDVLAARRALARGDAAEARRRALSAEDRARKSQALDAIVLALAALLDVTPEGREARRAELAAKIEQLEAVEPVIEASLALGRASSGGDAAAFARRAHQAAKTRGLVAFAAAAER
jgi:eukaryotic-like serine/threonine-protein kinase